MGRIKVEPILTYMQRCKTHIPTGITVTINKHHCQVVQGSASRSWHSYCNKHKLTPTVIGLREIQNTPLPDHYKNYEGIRISADSYFFV